MLKRRRFKQAHRLEERLAAEAESLRAEADALPPGAEKEARLRKARQADTARHMSEWLSSPGLRAPT